MAVGLPMKALLLLRDEPFVAVWNILSLPEDLTICQFNVGLSKHQLLRWRRLASISFTFGLLLPEILRFIGPGRDH